MTHELMIQSGFRSIVKQKASDVFFLVTEENSVKKYRVLPRGFVIRAEPSRSVQLLLGRHKESVFQ